MPITNPDPPASATAPANPLPARPNRAAPAAHAPAPKAARTAPVPRPGRHRLPRTGPPLVAAAGVLVVWLLMILFATRVQAGPGVQEAARFGHLAALVAGFGAALTVEWFGLLWLLRRCPLRLVTQVAQAAHLPIWLGLAGLAVTGVVLAPERLGAITVVKLVAVLVVALNGSFAGSLQRQLAAAGEPAPRTLLVRAVASAGVSQLGWWVAVVIGFLNAHA